MKKFIKASSKNYHKLIDKGFKPLSPTMIVSHSVKYFILTNDRYFINSIKKP